MQWSICDAIRMNTGPWGKWGVKDLVTGGIKLFTLCHWDIQHNLPCTPGSSRFQPEQTYNYPSV